MTSGYQRSTNPEPVTPALDRLEARIAELERERAELRGGMAMTALAAEEADQTVTDALTQEC